MSMELSAQREVLHHLTRTDPDPRVRRRAHALLLLSRGQSVMAVARLFETAPHRVRAWRSRFLIGGRQGLADAPRTGRPPTRCAGLHGHGAPRGAASRLPVSPSSS